MNFEAQFLRGCGPSQPTERGPWRPYEWNGTPGWNPAVLGRIETGAEARAAERARQKAVFAACRETGLTVEAAAGLARVGDALARLFERELRESRGAQ